jgi:uncharacterized DUF497 family protein
METDRFEWDDLKAAENLAKHAVSFDYAATVFDDRAARQVPDRRRDYGEDRLKLIGRAWNGRLLTVIFTERGDRIRLISARLASQKERNFYADP